MLRSKNIAMWMVTIRAVTLRHRCTEQTYGHQGGKSGGGGGGMNWEIGIDMYTLMCIKQITKKNLLYKK